ncbi:glutamate-5-semialdehyde dehydrogenase [Campylobacter iguaniorum]|uniref:glutamate-5-semialdehyde dehydrogenase n=1 Tax=Campylobacter iguaniorum TaxID=1244531 RepID=UPI0007C965A2|nr:glutamate-5-semialdehyde dehydrogenase [Campylobacter iguaniorum]ANE35813.1 glutamate-5-semialdehyde dehydrogenase [Campylobacter iguaniorum]
MEKLLNDLKKSSKYLQKIGQKNRVNLILEISNQIKKNIKNIIEANLIDLQNAKSLSQAMQNRLKFDENTINLLCKSLEDIANLKEVIGVISDGWEAKSGIKIQKISIPIGNICAIYESRPNVTAEVAALCIKSANGCVLKGGKEARNTNLAIMQSINQAYETLNLPKSVLFLDIDRSEVEKLIKMDEYLDLIVPRGGENLVKFVSQNATVPVLKHDKGVCHIYVDKSADLSKAINICVNAKCSRPSACNAAETVLIHQSIANEFLPLLKAGLNKFDVEIFGCQKVANILPCTLANEASWDREYLDFKLNLKIVENLEEAMEHINLHSSGHSEAIISEDYSSCEQFLSLVDSACVYANASTRFSDGGEFGFGAEVGISTNKLHARGPVGLKELTTYKYIIRGNGEIR